MPDFIRPSSMSAAAYGSWLLCSLLAVALAFPTAFIVLDHHGAERLPAHTHVAPLGEIAQTHLHTFEQAHLHGMGVAILDDTVNLVVRAAAETPWLVLFTLLGLALPASAIALGASSVHRWSLPTRPAAVHQVAARPPTPPPTLLLRSS